MRFTLISLALLFSIRTYALQDSTLKPALDTTLFKNDFEKNAFRLFVEDSVRNPLMMLMAINSNSDEEEFARVQKVIDHLVANLKIKTEKQKQPAKAYKIIFDDIHSTFLRKYNLVADFEMIFKDGTYNCVSASALYSLILKKMGADYAIREAPNHVYVIADPYGSNYHFETTDPMGGYWKLDEQFKKNYVEFLIKQKIVTQSDLNKSSTEEIFKKYYYNDEEINIYELAGLQYYNKGVEALAEKDHAEALKSFEKAYILYPSERILFLINLCLGNQIDEKKEYDQNSMIAVLKVLNYNDSDFFNKQAVQFFAQSTEEMLIKKNKTEEHEQMYNLFKTSVKNDSILKEITSIYYTYKGLALYYKSLYREALPVLKQAYDMQPEDLRLQAIISESVLRVASVPNDPQKIFKTLDDYVAQFPFLKSYTLVMEYYAKMYLSFAGDYFRINDKKNGLLYLSKFNAVKTEFPDLAVTDEAIGHAYGEASAYHVRQSDYLKARAYLEEGLKLSPLSEALNRKLNVLKDYR